MSDEQVPDSFADHPPTLGEKRAERSHSGADWKPRDLLLKLLREHDSGECVLSDLVVSYQSDEVAGFWSAASNRTVAVGLMGQAFIALGQG